MVGLRLSGSRGLFISELMDESKIPALVYYITTYMLSWLDAGKYYGAVQKQRGGSLDLNKHILKIYLCQSSISMNNFHSRKYNIKVQMKINE